MLHGLFDNTIMQISLVTKYISSACIVTPEGW